MQEEVFVAKLKQKFASFKSSFRDKEEHHTIEIKKLKSEAKTSISFKHKCNRVQCEFRSSIFDHVESCSTQCLGGNKSKVNTKLKRTKVLITKC